MRSRLKFEHAAPNQIALHQTEACITKSSCEISALLRNYTVPSGNPLTNVSGQPIGPIVEAQEIRRREDCMTEVKRHSILFWDLSIA
jgi:hypothetical protein